MVVTNLFGRILGVLRGIWRHTSWFKKYAFNAGCGYYGIVGGVIFAGWYTMCYNLIDGLLTAEITLNSNWQDAIQGAPGTEGIADVLEHANYYFPIDTLASLCVLYGGLWVSVHSVAGSKELVKSINSALSLWKK